MKAGFGILVAAVLASGCASTPQERATAAPCAAGAVLSEQRVTTSQGTIAYEVCAGTLSVAGDDGRPAADLFYTAYFAKYGDSQRPLSFVWNGGPGADSRLLHFEALGPRIFANGALTDNPATPLAASDLVFLDPAGTGFSRAASAETASALYGTVGDIAATTRFIRDFRNIYAREMSPLYLFGESFGTWRAAGTAEALADAGVRVAGIGLISGGIPLGEEGDRALSRALSLPNRTATALALNQLGPDLQSRGRAVVEEATRWARTTWYPALSDPIAIADAERVRIVADLARYHGMEPAQIDAGSLWISPRDFRTGLLDGETLDVFDMRRTGAREGGLKEAAILSYYRDTLGYSAGKYAGIEIEALPVGANWQYDQAPITEESLARAMAGEGPPSPSQPWTRRAMRKLPAMRTFVAAGLYDSLNSCAANEATVAALSPDITARFVLHCYEGGHMMYDDPAVGSQFGRDVISFLNNSSDQPHKEP